jgi:hypothetical protein
MGVGQRAHGGQDMEITTTIDGCDFTVVIIENKVTIYQDGIYSGDGVLYNGRIEDCPADLGEDVYEALDCAIREAEVKQNA